MELQAFIAMLVVVVTMATQILCMHIEIQYGNFEDLTCYTCPMKKNNTECNNWAPDIPCPFQHKVCKTVHRFNERTGESVQVDKMCSLPEDCSAGHVGCRVTDIDGEIECISCCSLSYCNVAVPNNISTTATQSAPLIGSAASHVITSSWTFATATLISLIRQTYL